MKTLFSRHYLAILASVLVGLLYVAPHVWFIFTEYDVYQGIPLMQVDNEDFYIARIQEIIDGHPLLGSPAYFEYKNQPPLSPPTTELLYALPTLIFGVSIVVTLIASKLILPWLLFLLVYALIYSLLGRENTWQQKMSSMAGAFFVVIGYDLINYHYALNLLTGAVEPSRWLVWTRPVNPIGGAIYLFCFLNFLWSVIQRTKRYTASIIGAGFFLGLMFASYFFSWGLAVSILAFTGSIYLLQHNWGRIKNIISIFMLGILFSSPYWYLSWLAKKSILYPDSLLKSGIFYTHYPILNKLVLVSLMLFAIFLVVKYFKKFKFFLSDSNHILMSALLLGSAWVFIQQVITGITVWPYHFVQYTIPISIIVMVVVFHDLTYKKLKILLASVSSIIIIASVWFGVYTQYITYANALEKNRSIQAYSEIFDWLNQQEEDCVISIVGDKKQYKGMSGMILAFTHCNVYDINWAYSLIPQERLLHSYMSRLRLRKVAGDEIDEYVKQNFSELRGYLYSNWAGLYGVAEFPDFNDPELLNRAERFPDEYRAFLKRNLENELNKYRLDYILSFEPLPPEILPQLSNIQLQKIINGIYIYPLNR